MAVTNQERVGKALELLNQGLVPFVEREMKAVYGDAWIERARDSLRTDRLGGDPAGREGEAPTWDTQALLSVLWNHWNTVFRKTLGPAERSMVGELRDARNRWAHQERFSSDDCYRVLDTTHRLLSAISAEEAAAVDREKQDLLRVRFDEQARQERRRVAVAPVEGQPATGYKPWREVVTPHPDVASGRYQQAEFAADLGQVARGEGSDEYRDPREFFRRTFVTEGLRLLLVGAVRRLGGEGADPVVELQTNFGGGKTHSMLALYHLCSGVPAGELAGIEPILEAAGVRQAPQARRAVLVGTATSPAKPHPKPDGTVVRTLWGELAWQLLGREGFALVAEDDASGVSPGSDDLRALLGRAAPCLVLIDEWVAYVRQLYGVAGLPGGSFDANMNFAQALSEAAKAVPRALVVATLPASDIEIGGEGGREAIARLANTLQRVDAVWKPASADESFEIVRRRLFQPIDDPALFRARDAVARAFVEMYGRQAAEFPSDCREAEYERRITAAYPIHPELFDRLYTDWSSLERFQRTRGVLRLMAAVIHSLWERQDPNLLILPASVPIDDPRVQFELTHYLEDSWAPVIEKDVDGPHSLPLQLDRDNPNLGRYSACRRVARTIYVGSAPTLRAAHRGLEDQRIKLGCTQPGESVATFGDALRRLTDAATHLYVDGRRYWFSTQPSVTRLAQDRAAQVRPDDVMEEIKRRLKKEQDARGEFVRVHPCPAGSGDVADEPDARLVILGPDHSHSAKAETSLARVAAAELLDQRGGGPRIYRNALVFLAPDRNRLAELDQAVRQYLAWKSIEQERETLNLDAFQSRQAVTKREQADDTVTQRIPETYQWLLVPGQSDPKGPVEWQEIRLQGQDRLATRASRRLTNDELLVTTFAGTRLRLELDRIPLWRGNHVSVKQLAEDFGQYLYLPRFKTRQVLEEAIKDGAALLTWRTDTFAYADGWDEPRQRYQGLRAGTRLQAVPFDGRNVLVRSELAAEQLAAEAVAAAAEGAAGGKGAVSPEEVPVHRPPVAEYKVRRPTRFHGTVTLNPTRVGRDAGQVAEGVIQHLAGLVGTDVKVTLEIEAGAQEGFPEDKVRTVAENCRTLRFENFGFEEG